MPENRQQRRRKAKYVLGEVKKLRKGLAMARANPELPHVIQLPTGQLIDVLDGETDKLVDQLEQFALFELGQRIPSGRA